MGRRRAGHASLSFLKNGKFVHLILNDAGRWIPTGAACGWRRCPRCRVPFENDPFDSGLCVTCYFYHSGLDRKEFWRLHKEGYWLAPYNISLRRCHARDDTAALKSGNWQKAIQEQGWP
jgi:hypothetical protein